MKKNLVALCLVLITGSQLQASLMPENPVKIIAGIAGGAVVGICGWYVWKNMPTVNDKVTFKEKINAVCKGATITFFAIPTVLAGGLLVNKTVESVLNSKDKNSNESDSKGCRGCGSRLSSHAPTCCFKDIPRQRG